MGELRCERKIYNETVDSRVRIIRLIFQNNDNIICKAAAWRGKSLMMVFGREVNSRTKTLEK